MRRTLFAVLAASLIVSAASAQESRPAAPAAAEPAVTVPTFHNEACPVMGKPAKTNVFVETAHGRVYLCCKACVKKVENDPEGHYKKAYATTKSAGNKTCPVTGEAVDKSSPTITVQGMEIAICCNDCAKPLLANSQIYLAKLANPKLNDLGNKVDPIDGKPVANNAFCVIGDSLIRLSSNESVEAVTKDPKKALEKAKEAKGGGAKDGGKKGGPQEGCCSGKGGEDAGCCSGGKGKAESKPAH